MAIFNSKLLVHQRVCVSAMNGELFGTQRLTGLPIICDGHINWVIVDNVYTGITADSNNKTVRKELNKHEFRTMVMNIRNPSGVKSLMYQGRFYVEKII